MENEHGRKKNKKGREARTKKMMKEISKKRDK